MLLSCGARCKVGRIFYARSPYKFTKYIDIFENLRYNSDKREAI